MAYSLAQQFSDDIDWYFLDIDDNIIHVASGGGRLPSAISENDNAIREIDLYIKQLPERFDAVENPNIDQFVSLGRPNFLRENEPGPRELYFRYFLTLARKGLYSYDKTVVGNFNDFNYHLVARPSTLERPSRSWPFEIRQLLRKLPTRLFEAGTDQLRLRELERYF